MHRRQLLGALGLVVVSAAAGQGLAPCTTATGRFLVFDRGSFMELEPRSPSQVVVAGDELIYLDHGGWLKRYSLERTDVLGEMPGAALIASKDRVIVRHRGALHLVRGGGLELLSADAGEAAVRDSFIAFHDRAAERLLVRWRGRVEPVAEIDVDTGGVQWLAGSNMIAYHDRSTRRTKLWWRGAQRTVCDSADFALVSCGGDITVLWDPLLMRLRAFRSGAMVDLDEVRPVSFKTGEGLVAYVDAFLRFKYWAGDATRVMLDHAPTDYWVRDSLVIFIDRGRFMAVKEGRPMLVETYIPEQWTVQRNTILYLGLDRDIRRFDGRESVAVSMASAIPWFKAYGDVIVHPGQRGSIHVIWQGRTYEY